MEEIALPPGLESPEDAAAAPTEERELTAPGYALTANGIPSSQPAPSSLEVPQPPQRPRRRARAWVLPLLGLGLIGAIAAVALVPRLHSAARRVAPSAIAVLDRAVSRVHGVLGGGGSSTVQSTTEPAPLAASAASEAPRNALTSDDRHPAAPGTPGQAAAQDAREQTAVPNAEGEAGDSAESPAPPSNEADASAAAHLPGGEAGSTAADTFPAGVDEAVVKARFRAVLHRATKCHPFGRAAGTAQVSVLIEPSGKVSTASLEGEPLASAPVGACILVHARSLRVPPFEGPAFRVVDSITLR